MVFTRVNSRFREDRICENCLQEFEAISKIQKFCSKGCKDKKRDSSLTRKLSNKKWSKENEDHRRNYMLKYNYGITLEQYNSLVEKQNHSCAVCKKHVSNFKKRLSVDHDHKTGEIFGLLCTYCNYKLIGRTRDPQMFLNAAEYLQQGTDWFVPGKKKKKRKKRKR